MTQTTWQVCPAWQPNFDLKSLDTMPRQTVQDFIAHRAHCAQCSRVDLSAFIVQQALRVSANERERPLDLPPKLVEIWDAEGDAASAPPNWHMADAPAILLGAAGAGMHDAFFACRLESVLPAQPADRLSAQGLLLGRLAFMRSSIPGVTVALEARFTFTPVDHETPAAMTVDLIGRYSDWRLTSEDLRVKAREFCHELTLVLASVMPNHQFRFLTRERAVHDVLAPFEINDTAEIRRTAVLPQGIPAVFGGVPDSEALMDLLRDQSTPTLVAITIAPVSLDEIFNTLDSALPDIGGANPNHIISSQPEKRVQESLRETLAEIVQRQADLLQRVQSLRVQSFLVRVQAASAGTLGQGMLATLCTECGGPSKLTAASAWHSTMNPTPSTTEVTRPRMARVTGGDATDFARACHNLGVLGFDPWGEATPALYLADLGEATRLLPLPDSTHWQTSRGIAVQLPFQGADVPGIRLGVNRHKGKLTPVVQPFASRVKHTWIIGQTGTGKSTLVESMILQDIHHDKGVIVIDPHGELLENVLAKIPRRRIEDVIFFDPADTERPMGINMIQARTDDEKALVVSALLGLMQKLFDPNLLGIVGPRFEHNIRNCLLTVLSAPEGGTMIELVRVITDPHFAQEMVRYVTDPMVKTYWEQIDHTNDFHRSEVLDWLVSKFGRFVTDPTLRRVIGQLQSAFNFREAMDSGKIVLLSLAKGKVGAFNANFLGLCLLPMILQAALSRTDTRVADRRQCVLYIDEFQNYATESLALMLAEARKYHLSLVLANQHIGQLTGEVRDALFGNVGSLISFRLGAADAEVITQLMAPSPVTSEMLTNLPDYTAYARILVNEQRAPACTIQTELPPYQADPVTAERVRSFSRIIYGRDRREVEQDILRRTRMKM